MIIRAAATAAAIAALWAAPALGAERDVFSALQENVWTLPTADGAARLYVTEIGEGAPVVFLHGGPGNDFNYMVDALRPHLKDHRFILFDQRGSLLSPVAPEKVDAITLDVLVEDLEALRRELGLERMALFGHSFGTLLAQAYFVKYPDRVSGMVLSASAPPFPAAGDFAALLKQLRGRMQALRARPEVADVLRAEGLDGDPATLSARQRSERRRIEQLAATNLIHVERWRRIQGGGVYYNSRVDDAVGGSLPETLSILPQLRTRPVPVMVVNGDQDYLDPAGRGWDGAAAATLQVRAIPSAGHYPWIDDPEAFAAAVAEGLRAATAGR